MTDPDDRLVLSPGILIVPVAELSHRVRMQLDDDEQDAFAITRPYGRSSSILVDAKLVALLEEFHSPSTVVEAILRFSLRLGIDPEAALTDSFRGLHRCRAQGFLVAEGSESAKPIAVMFGRGRRVAGGTVVRCLQVLEDSELHELRLDDGTRAALKVLRPGGSKFGIDVLLREAAVLRYLDGRVAPRLLAEGEDEDCQWLVLEWCDGVTITTAAAAARRSGARDEELLALCCTVAEAYAQLHELGVIHGDVHPGNVLVSPAGTVRIVDYGLAYKFGTDRPPPRAGVQAFYDPQHAAASRAGERPPSASFASDQYSLGAVLYELLTGSGYVDFSLDHGEVLRQVVEDEPLPFSRRGRRRWPEVEAPLAAALAKRTSERLPSVRELARRLAAVSAPERTHVPATSGGAAPLLDFVLMQVAPGGAWFEQGLSTAAPTCSIAYGAAGIAAAVYRVAALRADPQLLALADEWIVRAERDAGSTGAFSSEELGLSVAQTGKVSPFHSMSGVHAVQALISHAMGDTLVRQRAINAFVAASRQPCEELDLTLGASGTLLAGALLLERIAGARYMTLDNLTALGKATLDHLWTRLDAMPPITHGREVTYLGVAHGWAGMLLATLRWCSVAGVAIPTRVDERLDELAQLAQPVGRGVRWPHDIAGSAGALTAGWCHGSAGYVHLWMAAYEALRDERWATLAEQAARDACAAPNSVAQLCCGLGGQAYALLAYYTYSGERRWFAAAAELATRAARSVTATLSGSALAPSLHKGITGIAVLAADLDDPGAAAMPFFGREG